MATIKLGLPVVILLGLSAHALQQQPLARTKNTIFGDEKLEGQIFENVDDIERFHNEILTYDDQNSYRLPKSTKPVYYNVTWTIKFEPEFTSEGEVKIDIVATEENVKEIVLHSEELNITSVKMQGPNWERDLEPNLEPERQFLRISLDEALQYNHDSDPEVYTLTIKFISDLRNDMYGIYRSWYRNSHDEDVSWMASTQFQATSARKAFPCYDEPEFKAEFDITIVRPETHRSWSCTKLDFYDATSMNESEDLMVVDKYLTTPKMSTYLLALIVAEYNSTKIINDKGNLYEVIARPGAIEANQEQYAFDVGQKLLSKMSEHTNIDYYSQSSALKMTQAAIPDFSAGAMENWGLLTYREAYLMYDANHTDSLFKQRIAYILSHEIAHMWFGNLVTCDWWDVLWLNEGFARYYQYFLTDWVEGYMELETRFITEQVHTALLTDSANNPQPLSNPGVGSPAAVSAMFSVVSYNKGAAVIRMTEHLLGQEANTQGLRNYLVKHAYGTAVPLDLFNALKEAGEATGALDQYGSNFDFVEYYKSWTEQPGHPVLYVDVNHQTGAMTVQQRRFNINSGYSSIHTNYIVPITFATAENPYFEDTKPTHILSTHIAVIDRGSIGDHWVIFNKQQTGYYRVNYDDYTWDLIAIVLKENRTLINEYNRAQIVNDVFQFARSGLMTYTKAFNILSFLEFETDYAPWAAAITGFNWLRNRLAATDGLEPLHNLIIKWASVVMADLTYDEEEGEDFIRSYLRYHLAPLMCALDVDECRNAAVNKFRDLVDNGKEVAVDSRIWVYCNGLRNNTPGDFDKLWKRFLEHNVYTEKILLLQVLGCTPDQDSLHKFLDAILDENFTIRRQDYTTAFNSAVTGNEGNTQIVWEYVKNNMDKLEKAFSNPAVPLSYISSRLRTVAQINAFVEWAKGTNLPQNVTNSVIANAELTRESLQWFSTVETDMTDYFDNGNSNITTSTRPPDPEIVVSTEPMPAIEEPKTPDLPDSAVTAYVSIALMTISIAFNIIL